MRSAPAVHAFVQRCAYARGLLTACLSLVAVMLSEKAIPSSAMNPPRPPPAPSTALTAPAAASSVTSTAAAASASSAPFASTVWDPTTRGWLVPTSAQVATAALEDRSSSLALAANRAANTVTLHRVGPKKVRVVEREPRVLEEEDHLANVSAIIRRDFYPAIAAMESAIVQPTPMLRMRSGNQLETPIGIDATPAMKGDFEPDTPMTERPGSPSQPGAGAASTALQLHSSASGAAANSSPSAPSAAASQKYHPHELRLGTYLELHTSEDNAAYSEMKAKRRKLLNDKYFYANEAYEQQVNDQRLILLDSDKSRSGNLDSWKWEAKNRLFFYPDHQGQSELNDEDAMMDAASEGKSNAATEAALERARKRESRTINYENTRFPGRLFNPFPGVNSTSKSEKASSATPGSVTPAVGGYKLVQTPTPSASVLGVGGGGASPLMTWGNILATPSHLTAEDGTTAHPAANGGGGGVPSLSASAALSLPTSSGFHVAPPSARDEKVWQLVEKARKRDKEERKRKREERTPVPMGMATPSRTSGAAASSSSSSLAPSIALRPAASPAPHQVLMSPAAQRLMEKALQAKGKSTVLSNTAAMTSGVDRQLRASYATPSPAGLAHGRSGGAAAARPSGAAASSARPRVPQFSETPQPLHLRG
jgi:hypothetical protein